MAVGAVVGVAVGAVVAVGAGVGVSVGVAVGGVGTNDGGGGGVLAAANERDADPCIAELIAIALMESSTIRARIARFIM